MSFLKLAAELWRDYVLDGVPASGAHNPVKADLRAWGAEVEAAGSYVTIASGSLTGATIDITDIPQTFSELILLLTDASFDTAARSPRVQVSADNGSTWETTAAEWFAANFTSLFTAAFLLIYVNIPLAASTFRSVTRITGYRAGSFTMAESFMRNSAGESDLSHAAWLQTDAVNALRILISDTGNYDGGTYTLLGVR